MRGVVVGVGLIGLSLAATACTKTPKLEITNPCPVPVRLVTWDSSPPVIDVAAASTTETIFRSFKPMSAVSADAMVNVPQIEQTDKYGERFGLVLPEILCSAIDSEPPDVIVVEDVYSANRADPLQIRLFSSDVDHLNGVGPVEASLDASSPEVLYGSGYVAIKFSPNTPDGADGPTVNVDLTEAVDAALAVAGPRAIVLDCMERDCTRVATTASGALAESLVVQAER